MDDDGNEGEQRGEAGLDQSCGECGSSWQVEELDLQMRAKISRGSGSWKLEKG